MPRLVPQLLLLAWTLNLLTPLFHDHGHGHEPAQEVGCEVELHSHDLPALQDGCDPGGPCSNPGHSHSPEQRSTHCSLCKVLGPRDLAPTLEGFTACLIQARPTWVCVRVEPVRGSPPGSASIRGPPPSISKHVSV